MVDSMDSMAVERDWMYVSWGVSSDFRLAYIARMSIAPERDRMWDSGGCYVQVGPYDSLQFQSFHNSSLLVVAVIHPFARANDLVPSVPAGDSSWPFSPTRHPCCRSTSLPARPSVISSFNLVSSHPTHSKEFNHVATAQLTCCSTNCIC